MKILCYEQRTPEWRQARLGRLTSSRVAEAFAMLKSGQEAAGRRNLRIQLVLERLTGHSNERGFVSHAMQEGADREVEAQGVYEALTGRLLNTTGFVAHDTLLAGCSPDGFLDDWTGIIEAKCPLPATHLDYLRSGKIPGDYLKQVQHALWITGAEWCDWLSYQPDFPEPLRVKMVRVYAADIDMKAYELLVRMFLAECDREFSEVDAMAGAAF